MRILSIAWKDFRQAYRDLAGLALMIVAPLALTGALGAAFGSGDSFAVPPVEVVVADEDTLGNGASAARPDSANSQTPAAPAGSYVAEVLAAPQLSSLLSIKQTKTTSEARAAVDGDQADVAVLIPAGFTEALTTPGAAPVAVTLYHNPRATLAPALISAVLQTVIQRLEGARVASTTSTQLAISAGLTDQNQIASLASQAAADFATALETEPPLSLNAVTPVIPGAEDYQKPSMGAQVLLGMMIFFSLFGAATPARSIIEEDRAGTLSRLFTTPTTRTAILGGKYVAVFSVVLLQLVILLGAGRLLFGFHWGRLGPVIALTLCGALVATSLALLTVSVAKTPGQAGAVSSAVFVFLALIGGNFVPGRVGDSFATIRRFTPNGWLLEGWNQVLFGSSLGDITLPLLAALTFAVVFFGAATFFFRKRYS